MKRYNKLLLAVFLYRIQYPLNQHHLHKFLQVFSGNFFPHKEIFAVIVTFRRRVNDHTKPTIINAGKLY